MTSFVNLIKAVADAYASKHPFLPHPQGSPPITITEWPISVPLPSLPSNNFLSITTPPPTPVPRVINIEELYFFPPFPISLLNPCEFLNV